MSNERQQRAARAEQMRKERDRADRRQRNVITVAIVAVVVVLIAVGGHAIKNGGGDPTPSKYVAPANLSDPANFGFDYSAVDAGGKAGTKPVTVVLYEDFQCPVCKAFEAANGPFLDQQVEGGKITIQYRPYAFLDGSSSTNYATRSAAAAMCVLDKGGAAAFKKMHDILYANQPAENTAGLPNSSLIGFANQAGVTGLDSCIKSQKFAPWVKKAKAKWDDVKIPGTPTVVINGKTITGGSPNTVPQLSDLQKAITDAS